MISIFGILVEIQGRKELVEIHVRKELRMSFLDWFCIGNPTYNCICSKLEEEVLGWLTGFIVLKMA